MRQTNEAVCGLLRYAVMSDRQQHNTGASVHSCRWGSGGVYGKSTNLSDWLENGHVFYDPESRSS